MEFLKFVRKKSFLSELIYTILNIALAVGLLLIVRYNEAVWFAILLVLLSKWRIFAVRPRYWWANLRSNVVDIIVSVSVVFHMYTINAASIADGTKLLLLVIMTLLYIGWLLYIKPRSKRSYMALQAGVAIFLGMSALFTISFNWPVSVVVVGAWLIGYSATRHILGSYDDETHGLLLGLVWGLVVAEITWVAYHWAIAYPLPIVNTLMIPQASIAVTLVSFLAYKCYDSFYHHAKIRTNDILLPLLFTVSIMIVLVLVFNRVGTAI
jgi:hypothetical protein